MNDSDPGSVPAPPETGDILIDAALGELPVMGRAGAGTLAQPDAAGVVEHHHADVGAVEIEVEGVERLLRHRLAIADAGASCSPRLLTPDAQRSAISTVTG